MSKMLVLARGDGRNCKLLNGDSIFAAMPFEVVLFVDRANARHFENVPPNVSLEVVRWSDRAGVEERVRRQHEEHGLFALATLAEETIDFAASLRERLGIRGASPADTARFRDKLVMKGILGRAGIRVPEHAPCEDRDTVEQLLLRHGRLAVKPVDGQGSKEVSFVSSSDELSAWYDRNRDVARFEAEEFIEGTLYHINAVVRDGAPILTATAPYLPGMANIDFAAGTPFVSVMLTEGELKQRLEEFSTKAIQSLGLRNGVTHMECFVTAKGEIVFLETAIRPGGGGIVQMIEAQYGVNYAQAALLLEAGHGDLIRVPKEEPKETLGLIGFRQPFSGFAKRVPSQLTFAEPWVRHTKIDLKPGDFLVAAAHCTDFMGLLVFASLDHAEFDVRRHALHRRFYAELEVQPL